MAVLRAFMHDDALLTLHHQMLDLGVDVLEQVLLQLSSHDLANLAQTCRSFRELVDESHVWNLLYELDFPLDSAKLPGSGLPRYKTRYCARLKAIKRDECMERAIQTVGTNAIVDFATISYFDKGRMAEGVVLRRINDIVEVVATYGTCKKLSTRDFKCTRATYSYVFGVKNDELLMWNTKTGRNEDVETLDRDSDLEVIARIPNFLMEKLNFNDRKFDRACDTLVNPRMIYEMINCTDTGAIFKLLRTIPGKIDHLFANHNGIAAVSGNTLYLVADVEWSAVSKTRKFDARIVKIGVVSSSEHEEDGSFTVYVLDNTGRLYMVFMPADEEYTIFPILKAEGVADFNSDRDMILLYEDGSVARLGDDVEPLEAPKTLQLHQTFRGGIYALVVE